ncbi:hypothetical protein GUJ93_ZPchr0458g22688 [Zizania palustris]|uniref:Phytocyanin domain-containing protein n=1 Tax=Zizania palustris TaxID=103762 RepID=A0A8J5R0P1_ZIZPA|nr:hypothetical protein GUJ93_ZPchr0458g22688 [Zizania palustris]
MPRSTKQRTLCIGHALPRRGARPRTRRLHDSLRETLTAASSSRLAGHSTIRVSLHGWVVPPAKEPGVYNQWASKNRFLVGDSVHFKYGKDSVMVVTEDDYNMCSASHPIFFSNNGDTEVRLDRQGFFYFISGVTGHCERGQRMIIKRLRGCALASASVSSSGSSLSPEQRRRADTNFARRNIRLAESKASEAGAGPPKLEELLVKGTWLEALPGNCNCPSAQALGA